MQCAEGQAILSDFGISGLGFRVYDDPMSPLLDARGVTVELATAAGRIRPVNDVSLCLDAGESLGLVGESGSGKTMFALALMGLLPPGARVSGEVWLEGADAARGPDLMSSRGTPSEQRRNLTSLDEAEWRALRGREIAMIFQEPMTSLNPVLRVGLQIEEAIRAHERNIDARTARERTIAALESAAVPEPQLRAQQFPHQLSGGLRQRAMIAMALASGSSERDQKMSAGPRLLIADEPTTALDVTVQKQILDLLDRLRRELRLGLIFITHDLGVVAQVADRLAVLYAGRVVEQGPAREVLTRPRHPYTQGLLAASPRLERAPLAPIPGSVPRLDALPPGCAFEPRCPKRVPECAAALPDLRVVSRESRARCILVGTPGHG